MSGWTKNTTSMKSKPTSCPKPSSTLRTACRRSRLLRRPRHLHRLPTILVREVTYTEPAVKGDTSGKVMKPAKIATGYELSVPAFVEAGDKIEIDTRTGEYRNRVK